MGSTHSRGDRRSHDAAVVHAQAAPPVCLAGTSQSFTANGTVQTYLEPGDATALLVQAAGGADGESSSGISYTVGLGASIATEVR